MYILQAVLYVPIIAAVLIIAAITYYKRTITGMLKFSYFTLTVAAWMSTQALAQLNISSANNLLFVRATSAISVVMGLALYLFVFDYLGIKKSKIITSAIYVVSLVFLALNLSRLVVYSVTVDANGISITDASIIYTIQLLFSGLLAATAFMRLYFRARHNAKPQRIRNYLLIVAVAQAIVFSVGASVLFPTQAAGQYVIILSVFFMIAIIAYAVIKHKLFDIRAAVARSISYLLIIVTISSLYGLLAFSLIGGTFFKSNTLSFVQELIYVFLAVILSFTFQPLRRFFEKITNRIFYRDRYDAQDLINNVGRILAMEIELGSLSNKVISEITRQIKIEDADIIILDHNKVYYDAHLGQHESYDIDLLKKLGKSVIAVDDLQGGERKDILEKYGVAVSLALRSSEEFVGFLFIGRKLSGDIYTDADIAVLKIIANELAVGVQNAKAYTEIQKFNETLQAKVEDATKRLRHANDELKELDEAKDEFISMASHQLRTPLTTTKGYVSMVLEGDFGKPSKDMKEPLTQALDGANRMARMVSDLLNVSRMDAGKFFIDAHDSELSKVVPDEVNSLQTLAATKQVTLTYHEPKHKIPIIQLDEDKMRQVIMNLIDNSIHYGNKVPGTGKTDVSLELEGNEVVFKVVDNGIGVPKAVQPKLFGKFFRAGNAQNARPDGTGLGLFLVKRVVEDHGGKIIFESVEGKGSTFGFRMPLHTVIHNDPKAMKRLQSAQVATAS